MNKKQRVKMLIAQSGPNLIRNIKDVIDVDFDEATRLKDAGFAEFSEEKLTVVERSVAIKPKIEKAVQSTSSSKQ